MNARKWEDLQSDCLVKVFEKVGIDALAQTVPFVCKSWYKSSLDPFCWKHLIFPINISANGIKAIVDRCCGNAIEVLFLPSFQFEDFMYLAERCPKIEVALLPNCPFYDLSLADDPFDLDPTSTEKYKMAREVVPKVVGKWKNLKYLMISTDFYFEEIITEVGMYCENLLMLQVCGNVGPKEVSSIINSLPGIKGLKLEQWTIIPRECFLKLLVECKELEMVDARKCIGFDADDEEILKMAERIKVLMVKGSTLSREFVDDFPSLFSPVEVEKLLAVSSIDLEEMVANFV